jgi:hypothetical protein
LMRTLKGVLKGVFHADLRMGHTQDRISPYVLSSTVEGTSEASQCVQHFGASLFVPSGGKWAR